MRKIQSFCLIWIIIMTFLMWTGCAKTTGGAADTLQEVESVATGQSVATQEIEAETSEPPEATQEAETAASGQFESTLELKTKFEPGGESINLVELSLLSDKLSLLIPDSFDVMSDEVAELKYTTDSRPTLVYTNGRGTIHISLHYLEDTATETQLAEYQTFFIGTIQNRRPYVDWLDSGIIEINSKKVAYLELMTKSNDIEVYNLIWFTDLDGRLLLTIFNCTEEFMEDWKPIARTIMDSQQYS